MSSGFDQREEGFETQFKLEQEQKFRATARRNKMLGRWAAERMSLPAEEVDAYVMDVVKSDFEEAGDEDVLRKVMSDLEAKGVPVSAEELRKVMDDFYLEACKEVSQEG
ncbi:MAG: DUF1476 domain-containing protein [Phycisphaerales bacterium]|nr:DUF1476 domain-containing protein [Phycisphaerales bacterium]